MREIKYRGLYMGNWWFASVDQEEGPCDCWEQFWYVVDRKTVGQYTGLKDKNGVEIYEGDVVKYIDSLDSNDYWEGKGEVVFIFGAWTINDNQIVEGERLQLQWVDENVEIIGNVYQNPELLNENI